MTFSIVTISFNQRQYLEQAMNSVLEQEDSGVEYIVVDPGSTDGSRELVQSYSGRVAQMIFEPDRGPADGLNKGFELATGEIFGFLNSDDAFLPGAFRSVGEIFEQDADCDIVMGSGFIVDGRGSHIRRVQPAGFTVNRYFYGAATWLQQATFFRKRAFNLTAGFNVMNRSCWDGELVVEMVAKGAKVRYLHRDIALFRIHPQSITGSKRHKEMMKADMDRMFSSAFGRGWNALDELRSRLYRVERILTHPGAIESAIKARLPRRESGSL